MIKMFPTTLPKTHLSHSNRSNILYPKKLTKDLCDALLDTTTTRVINYVFGPALKGPIFSHNYYVLSWPLLH